MVSVGCPIGHSALLFKITFGASLPRWNKEDDRREKGKAENKRKNSRLVRAGVGEGLFHPAS